MKSYKAEELFDEDGRLLAELADLAPKGDRRMGANPHANGGLLLHDLRMPDFHKHAVTVPSPGAVAAQDTMVLGKFLRDVAKLNRRNEISGYSGLMRRCQIFWVRSLRSPTVNGMHVRFQTTNSLPLLDKCWTDAQRASV